MSLLPMVLALYFPSGLIDRFGLKTVPTPREYSLLFPAALCAMGFPYFNKNAILGRLFSGL